MELRSPPSELVQNIVKSSLYHSLHIPKVRFTVFLISEQLIGPMETITLCPNSQMYVQLPVKCMDTMASME